MKQRFEHVKNRAKAVSTRSLALMLCFVMLITAIGAGTMMTAFALNTADAVVAQSSEGSDADLGDTAPAEEPDAAPADDGVEDADESAVVRDKDADLADTGYSLSEVKYLKLTKSGGSEVSYNINNGVVSVNIDSTGTYYFYIKMNNGDNLTNTGSLTGSVTNWPLYLKGSTTNSCTLNVSTTGTYVFNFSISSSNVNMSVTYPSGGSSGETTYILTGDNAITGTSGWKNSSTNNAVNVLAHDNTTGYYTIEKTVSYTTGSFKFRIVPENSWVTTWGVNRANEVDTANIATWDATNSDNNITLTLSQPAKIKIRFDDTKTDTSAITVIITPTTSTVTAAVTPAGSGTAKVGGLNSQTVAYNGTVNLSATPADYYVFDKWTTTNQNVTFANSTSASTTATVTGDDTVTANFVNKSYTVSKGTGTGFTITAPSSAQTKKWDTSVTVTAKTSSDLYYLDYLYYLDNNTGEKKVLGSAALTGSTSSPAAAADGAGTATSITGTFTMPTNNVTVYAHAHLKPSYKMNFAVSTDSVSAGHGYVTAGIYYSGTTNVKYTIDNGADVLQNGKVNIGARPASGYYFDGWYPNPDGSGTKITSDQDVTVTMNAAKNYFAVFKPLAATSGVRLLIHSSNSSSQLHIWNIDNGSTGNMSNTTWGKNPKLSTYGGPIKIGSDSYYILETSDTTFNFMMRDNNASSQSSNEPNISSAGTYIYTYDNVTTLTQVKYKTSSHDWDLSSYDWYYPVRYNVTNPELGTTYYTANFVKAGGTATFYHTPSNTDDYKTSRQSSGFSSAAYTDANRKTTSTSSTRTMPSSYAECVFTTTFVPKDYYKVTFTAGAGGTIKASTGSTTYAAANDIKNETSVKEGTDIAFVATPATGYEVAGWSGDVSGTGTTNSISGSSFTSEKTVRVYFKKSKGTSSTATYLGYRANYDDPTGWDNFVSTYVWNGRVYGYIDNVTSGTPYHFQAYSSNPSTTAEKATKQYYRNNAATWANTQFSADILDIKRKEYNKENGTCYYISFEASSSVEAVMIDLGPEDSSTAGQARPDLDSNTYHIIPIYNTDVSKVTVYAKDATFRDDSNYDYMPGIADTVISVADSDNGVDSSTISHQTEFDTAVAEKGKKIKITTTINNENDRTGGVNLRNKFYVKGFSFNGVTPELYTANNDGVYTCTYTIPADFEDDYLEVTPIYFLRDDYLSNNSNGAKAVVLYIENYDQTFQDTGWGNTLSVYPYYSTAVNPVYSKANVFGGYPGMPVINYGGRRFVQIPTNYKLAVDSKTKENNVVVTKDTAGTAAVIKGITLSNDYFDIVHRDYCREVDTHLQTYDFDDFYKIYHETTDGYEINDRSTLANKKVADQITFAFKYRNKIDNFGATKRYTTSLDSGSDETPNTITLSTFDSSNGNGWDQLLDYHDRPINIFGKILSTAEQTNDPIYVVSNGYEYTHAGNYATTYTAYYNNNGTYSKITTITPSALLITSESRITEYPDAPKTDGGPDLLQISGQTLNYEALMPYADRPVMITYEEAIRNSSTPGEDYYRSGLGEVSTRSDGRWFYSYMNEEINADLRIDYGDEDYGDDVDAWSHDTFKSGTNTGTATGATVHFTNTATDADGSTYPLTPYHDTADWTALDPDNNIIYSNFNHYYKFEATEGAGYIFMGWYMERDGIQTAVTPDNVKQLTGQSQMTSNATFVARYVKNPAGHITINHTIADGSTGSATTYIKVVKIDSNGNRTTMTTGTDGFDRVDSYSINDTDVMAYGSGYTLEVTLKTVPNADTAFERFSASEAENDKSSEYFAAASAGATTTTFQIPVEDLFELNASGFPQQKEYYNTFTYYSHTELKPVLTVNHKLDATSHAKATGTTYVKAEVLTAGNDLVTTYGGTEAEGYKLGTDDIVIPSTYFNATDSYKVKVYLKTVMTGFTQFDKFSIIGETISNEQGSKGQQRTVTTSGDTRTVYATETFALSSLFTGGEPDYTVLPYLSKLTMPDYKYEFKYTYPSYIKNSDGTYSNQSYTARESFADEDLNEYMTLTNGDLAFQDDTKKRSFICSKAPYEDNFQKTLDWSTAAITSRSYNVSNDYVLAVDISASNSNTQLSAYFDFPYATTDSNEFVPLVTDGKVIKTDTNQKGKTDIYGRDWFVTNDVRNSSISGTPEFVKAPLIIVNQNGTPLDSSDDYNEYFCYWKVESEATANNVSREFTRCYDYEFNLAIFQNCIITPVYDTVDFATRGMAGAVPTGNTEYDYSRFDPDVNRTYYLLEGNGVSITFLENSRNQYNNGDSGSVTGSRSGAADRIYSDFLLTFDVDPMVKLQDTAPDTKQAGLIIQPVAYLEDDGNGGYTVRRDDYYEEAAGYGGYTPTQIKAYLEGTGSLTNGVARSKFDVTNLDNKNRIQYYYGINNATPKTNAVVNKDDDGIIRVGATSNNQKIVYKAFAYVGDGAASDTMLSNVYVSQQPVYFTIYETGIIAPGFYMPE